MAAEGEASAKGSGWGWGVVAEITVAEVLSLLCG